MISPKYVCMMEGCNFITDDLGQAQEHFNEGTGHYVIEVSSEDNEIYCTKYLENSQYRDFDD